MGTHHIIFIHGVHIRQSDYATNIINEISSKCPHLSFNFIPLFWGNVSDQQEDKLRFGVQNSSQWQKFWFRTFRETILLQFVGDIALYTSRYVGAQVVALLRLQLEQKLQGYDELQDRVHLVTHSLGTVILFDLLFSSRWTQPDVPGYDDAMAIRRYIYGIEPDPSHGLRLGSIHTMGSPIDIYNLLEVKDPTDKVKTTSAGVLINSHDIVPSLQNLIYQLQSVSPLPWLNFAHPGDPVSSPLEGLLPELLGPTKRSIVFTDIVLSYSGIADYIYSLFRKTAVPIIYGPHAHGCYWTNNQVSTTIVDILAQYKI